MNSTKDELREQIQDWDIYRHICDDEGFGCKIEEYTPSWGGKGYRCSLKQESEDKLLDMFTERERLARVSELEWVKDDSIMQGVKIRSKIDDRLSALQPSNKEKGEE